MTERSGESWLPDSFCPHTRVRLPWRRAGCPNRDQVYSRKDGCGLSHTKALDQGRDP